jgi:hypothetical protein
VYHFTPTTRKFARTPYGVSAVQTHPRGDDLRSLKHWIWQRSTQVRVNFLQFLQQIKTTLN